MAVFDVTADPIAAVAAFLGQFSISNTGAVRYVAGSDTFHVTWLHRSLQRKAYDLTISGDDDIQLSDPNPSTTAALGQIIRLIDHTPSGFVHRYNIDQQVSEYLFGGSVSQKDASGDDEAWYPLGMSGVAGGTVELQVIQNNVQLTSFWGTGLNQTGTGVLNRILVKAVDAGVLIDGGVVTVKAHDWGFSFANWTTTLGLTEASAFISAGADAFNTTLIATVSAYGITPVQGYNLLDLDGNGPKPYLDNWSYSPQTSKQALYEFVKWILSRDSGQTLYGVPANLWTGRVFEVDVGGGDTTDFQQNEGLTWPTGTGNLVGMDDLTNVGEARLWLHLATGTAPVNGETITGGTSTATTVVGAGGSTQLETSPNHLGQFTGSWLAADGIGFNPAQVTNTDSFTDLDGNVVSPPDFVNVNGTIEAVDAGDVPHVFLTLRSGSAPIYNQHTVNGAQTSGAGTVVINGAIPATTPLSGYIGLLDAAGDNFVFYEYSSWSGSTFTLTGTLGESYADGDTLMVAYFYNAPSGAGTTKTVTSTLIYGGSPIDVIGWVRQGDEAAPDAFIPITGQIGAGGFTFSADLQREV